MKKLKFALLGVGRIGKIHARNISLNTKSSIEFIYDINKEAANNISKLYGGKVASSAEEAISNPEVDAVFICTATPTHIDYILMAAKAGKSIFCEKPIDLETLPLLAQCRQHCHAHIFQKHLQIMAFFYHQLLSSVQLYI